MTPIIISRSKPERLSLLAIALLLISQFGLLKAQSNFELNINCGGAAYTSSTGENYVADVNFDNGIIFSNTTVTVNNTADQTLYHSERYDDNLSYSIPVPINGYYQVSLHFAEVFNKNQAVNKRVFDMLLEGTLVLDDYDIFASVGGYTADVKIFQVQVTDGILNITSSSSQNKAKLCAIQVIYNPPVCNDPNHVPSVDTVYKSICSTDSLLVGGAYQNTNGYYVDTLLNKNSCDSVVVTDLTVTTCTTPAYDLRINCGGADYIAVNGDFFHADSLFTNGTIFSNFSKSISNTNDDFIFQSERYDLNLAYAIPVPNGSYDVHLYFAETFNKVIIGSSTRVFDISIEGTVVENDYNILADVGGDFATIKKYTVNVQDQIVNIVLNASQNNAKLCAIRVVSTPVDCQLGPWSAWSSCDVSCGGGQQFRTRQVLVPTANGGAPCGPTIEYRSCNTQVCPVDCQVSAWGPWSACDASCDGGQQYRTRSIITPASNGGQACPNLIEYRACNTQPCPVDCQVSAWSPWSACDASCDGGQQYRTRSIITPASNGGQACPNLIEYRACNTQPCPVDCQVSAWSPWSACDASCDGGQQYRTRSIITPASNGGQACPNLIEYRTCNTQPCTSSGQCPKDTTVYTSMNSCDTEVHFTLDSSGIKTLAATSNYLNVPQSLNDCPKHAFYGSSSVILTPSSISGTATGSDVNLESVYLKMGHKRIGDLVIDLESPNGTVVRLIERPGKTGLWGNGGCTRDDIDALFVTGTGNSAENDCSGNRPVLSGNYTAHDGHDLTSLNDGSDPNGVWTLKVYDLRNKKKPTLKGWALNFRSSMGQIIQIAGLPSGSVFPLGTTTNTLVFIDSLGNDDTCSFDVTVEDNTPPEFIDCPQDVLVCGDPVNWTVPSAVDNCGAVTVVQTGGPAQGSSLADGTYPVTYEATDAAGNTQTCNFNLVKAPLSVDAGNDQLIYQGVGSGCTLLFATPQNGQWPYTYSWSDGDTSRGNIVCPNTTTEYIVTVTDANGCSGTDTVNVEVVDISCGSNKVMICFNSTTYCVNSWLGWYYTSFMGASYGSCQGATAKKLGDPSQLGLSQFGTKAMSYNKLDVFPNPSSSQTNITWEFATAGQVEVSLHDLTGRRIMDIYSGPCAEHEIQSKEIRTDHLAPGVYLINAKSGPVTQTTRLHIQ